jgi:hypothetical protein
MSFQDALFRDHLDPIRLKEGKEKCPCCKRPMKAYGYNLNKKQVDLAYRIFEWCARVNEWEWNAEEVFKSDVRAHKQFSKLQYHGIIKLINHNGIWKITKIGTDFLTGRITLPRKVWVFDNHVILRDDSFVHVDKVEPEWKIERADWIMDYIPQPYKTTLQPSELLL